MADNIINLDSDSNLDVNSTNGEDEQAALSLDELRNTQHLVKTTWSSLSTIMNKYHAQLELKLTQCRSTTNENPDTEIGKQSIHDNNITCDVKFLKDSISSLEKRLLKKDTELVQVRTDLERLKHDLSIKDNLVMKLQKQMSRESIEFSNEISMLKEALEQQQTDIDLGNSAGASPKKRKVVNQTQHLNDDSSILLQNAIYSHPDDDMDHSDEPYPVMLKTEPCDYGVKPSADYSDNLYPNQVGHERLFADGPSGGAMTITPVSTNPSSTLSSLVRDQSTMESTVMSLIPNPVLQGGVSSNSTMTSPAPSYSRFGRPIRPKPSAGNDQTLREGSNSLTSALLSKSRYGPRGNMNPWRRRFYHPQQMVQRSPPRRVRQQQPPPQQQPYLHRPKQQQPQSHEPQSSLQVVELSANSLILDDDLTQITQNLHPQIDLDLALSQSEALSSVDFQSQMFSNSRKQDMGIPRLHHCHLCHKRFSSPGHLKRHGLSHSERRYFACSVCGTQFKHKHHLTDHMRRHNPGPHNTSTSTNQDIMENDLAVIENAAESVLAAFGNQNSIAENDVNSLML